MVKVKKAKKTKKKKRISRDTDDMMIYKVTPEAPFVNLMLFSEAGEGKTTLAASAQDHPEMANVLFANIEGGLMSVAHRQDISSVDISSVDDLYELFWKLQRRDKDVRDFNTIVIDNVSELQRMDLEQIVQNEVENSTNKNRVDPDDIWQEDYGKNTVRLERILRWFKNLPINLIITAHPKFVYPKVGRGVDLTEIEPTVVIPKLTQSLCKSVLGLVDFVWFMKFDPEEDRRWLLTQPDGTYYAKTRGHKFSKAMGAYREFGYGVGRDGKDFMMAEIYQLLVDSESGRLKKKKKKKVKKVKKSKKVKIKK